MRCCHCLSWWNTTFRIPDYVCKEQQAMINSKTVFDEIVNQISLPGSRDEIRSIVLLWMEHEFSVTRLDILAGKPLDVTDANKTNLAQVIKQINNHEPIQYILGEAEFFGRPFKVGPAVLIPRPETEELILAVKKYCVHKRDPKILDIGTGSGCLPVTLALELKSSEVSATDISESALKTASDNARSLGAKVNFICHDILKEKLPFTELDLVVSNPPYITEREKSTMEKNVLDHEPAIALFVPDDNPFIFYHAIASKTFPALAPGGLLLTEINELFGNEIALLFADNGFDEIEVLKDINNKDRIVKGRKRFEM
jgi:release factor glutamine methyltransferase